MADKPAPEGTQKVTKNHHLWVGLAVSLGLVVAFLALFTHQGLYRIYRLHQERQQLDQMNAQLAAENDLLTRTVDRLQHDPEMIQDLIRRELNFVKKNEVIVQFPPEPGKRPTPSPYQSSARSWPKPGAGGKDERSRSLPGAPEGAPGAGTLRRGDPPPGGDLLSAGPVSPGRRGQQKGAGTQP